MPSKILSLWARCGGNPPHLAHNKKIKYHAAAGKTSLKQTIT